MKWLNWFCLFFCLVMMNDARAQTSNFFSGVYGGLEAGSISYNTQITFDGVDDPAGRSAAGYGGFLGYNVLSDNILLGAEFILNFASAPGPYTFDQAANGFSELEVRRGTSAGLDLRIGYLIAGRFLLNAKAGYSANSQSVRIKEDPLEIDPMEISRESFRRFQFGAGFEASVHPNIAIRFSFRTLAGFDLEKADVTDVPTLNAFNRFDVEPSQQQFFSGVVLRF